MHYELFETLYKILCSSKAIVPRPSMGHGLRDQALEFVAPELLGDRAVAKAAVAASVHALALIPAEAAESALARLQELLKFAGTVPAALHFWLFNFGC